MDVTVQQVDGQDHLDQVGAHRPVGDLHSHRRTGGAGGVLQVRDVVDVDLDVREVLSLCVVDGVDTHHVRLIRSAGEESLHRGRGGGGGEHHGRGGVPQGGVQAFGMAGQLGSEQRNGDVAGLHGGEERGHVIEALGCQDGHPFAAAGESLQPRGDGGQSAPELRPGVFDGASAFRGREVQVAVGDGVTDVGDVAVDQ